MLDGLKRLFARGAPMPATWEPVAAWADERRHAFRGVGESEGFVIDGQTVGQPWRLEWGPSQRPYVPGHELRLRAEGGVKPDVQALVLDRTLQASMEQAMFDQYVDGVQTRIDDTMPPEMRWLVMLDKLGAAELGPLRENFAAVVGSRSWARQWLDGPLTKALLAAPLASGQPLVLIVGRGRVTLRTEMPDPAPRALEAMLQLFVVAVRQARRASTQVAAQDGPSTQGSDWPTDGGTSGLPGDCLPPGKPPSSDSGPR